MTPRRDVRAVVDDLLAVEKIPVGIAAWAPSSRDGDLRLKQPLLIGQSISDATLTLIAYPRSPSLRFRVVLSYQRAISRLDFVDDDHHINSQNRPSHLPPGPINEPHYHSWRDNRRFATANHLPERLLNASVLPKNIRTFESAYRWFCAEANIRVREVPELPIPDTLL